MHVGDHADDMHGARTAGALPVGVLTGTCPAEALRPAGAQVNCVMGHSLPGLPRINAEP
ncbi:HAD family hydrolase [Streptomyces sp. NPDC002537]